ncbi:MAG TPA: hypothetical protein VHZ24_20740 [Pirellulales bacterium]|jgi:hypothetical protein|nr:hypothetical protein [Pirellulales bacterium]
MVEQRERVLGEGRRREVCAILAVGGTREVAAHYVGCSEAAILATALKHDDFREQLHRSESQHEISHLQNIQVAAKKEQNWRASVWALERKYPQRYGRRRPDVITTEQFAFLLTQLGEIVAKVVRDDTDRQRVLKRLRLLMAPSLRARQKRKQ